MSDMPKEIWTAPSGNWWDRKVFEYGMEKYIRADIHDARVNELLKNNNELLERARKAENG